LTEFAHSIEYERGGFWRRALALLIDVVSTMTILQLVTFALFPLTNGRVQFVGGLALLYCDKLDAVPEGVPLPADFRADAIADCWHGFFSLTSARIVTVSEVTRYRGIETTKQIVHLLDAEGKPFSAPTLDGYMLIFLLALRCWLDRGRGTPGRRICRVRLSPAADGHHSPPLGAVARRYAAQTLPLVPLIVWSLLRWRLTDPQAGISILEAILLTVPAVCLLIAVPIAVHAIVYRRDAWYDRWAVTSVLRLDKSRAPVPVVAAASPPVPAEGNFMQPPALPGPQTGNYFARHWRGELSLPMSYWVNGVVLGVISSMATGALTIAIIMYGPEQPTLWLIAAEVGWLVVSLFVMWQVVGIWRAATRYKQSGHSFWGGAAKTVAALGVLHLAYNWVFVAAPQVAGTYEIVTGDAAVGPHQFRVLADGQILEFSGGITFGAARELENLLDARGNVTTLQLNSIGGRIHEAQRMSEIVKARGLSTYVMQDCMSACTIVFLGGRERLLRDTARLGFHQPTFRGMTAGDRRAAIAEEEARLQGFGLSRNFAERANAALPDGMWFPENDELVREKLVTRIIVAPPPMPTAPSPPVVHAAPAAPQATSVFPTPGAPLQPAPGTYQTGPAVIPADLIKRLTPTAAPKAAGATGNPK
jgi:hypothetical protein